MREMGIRKQSLYDTFGDKRKSYLKALAYIGIKPMVLWSTCSNTTRSVKDGFAKLLYDLAGETREQHERGCLLRSANLQRDPGDVVVAEFLRDNQARVEAIFVRALRRANNRENCSVRVIPMLLVASL